jgi:hypothetical protein
MNHAAGNEKLKGLNTEIRRRLGFMLAFKNIFFISLIAPLFTD